MALLTGQHRIAFTREEITALADFAHVNEQDRYSVERDTDGVLFVKRGQPNPRGVRPLYRLSPRNPEKVTT